MDCQVCRSRRKSYCGDELYIEKWKDWPIYDLIGTNAHVHGISVGNRSDCEDMMRFVGKHKITPVIHRSYAFADAVGAIRDIDHAEHIGKLTVII